MAHIKSNYIYLSDRLVVCLTVGVPCSVSWMQGHALQFESGCVTGQPSRGWGVHGSHVSVQSKHCEMHTAAPGMVKMSEAVHNVKFHKHSKRCSSQSNNIT
jgi:hypothetical protein